MWGAATKPKRCASSRPVDRARARIEDVFGTWKRCHGLRGMRRRGLAKAAVQVHLTAVACNLKRTTNSRGSGMNIAPPRQSQGRPSHSAKHLRNFKVLRQPAHKAHNSLCDWNNEGEHWVGIWLRPKPSETVYRSIFRMIVVPWRRCRLIVQ
jgi:hypothetical protein